MELTEQQKDTVRQWVRAGATLSEVQKRLTSDLGVSMTYMDVRVLVIDLGVEVRNKPAPAPAPPPLKEKPEALPPGGEEDELDATDLTEELPPAGGASRVKVEVDRIMKAGSVVSGTVTFSDGVSGSWSLDHYGRLALSATPGYTPNRDDVMAFQGELQKVLGRQGY
jgi:hypothetical protein